MMELKQLKLSDILPNPFQDEEVTNRGDIDELVSSIRLNGVLQPPSVRLTNDGTYETIFGSRRIKAAKIIATESNEDNGSIECFVREGVTDEEMKELTLAENIAREDPHELDKGKLFSLLLPAYSNRIDLLANQYGMKIHEMKRILSYQDLPEEVKALWRADILTLGHINLILPLSEKNALAAISYCTSTDRDTDETQLTQTVTDLKRWVSRLKKPLDGAIFPYNKKCGMKKYCLKCPDNTMASNDLFAGAIGNIKEASCLDRKCYDGKVNFMFNSTIKKWEQDGELFYVIGDDWSTPYDIPDNLENKYLGRGKWEVVPMDQGVRAMYYKDSWNDEWKRGEVVYVKLSKRTGSDIPSNYYDKKFKRDNKRKEEKEKVVTDSRQEFAFELAGETKVETTLREWQIIVKMLLGRIQYNQGTEEIDQILEKSFKGIKVSRARSWGASEEILKHIKTIEDCKYVARMAMALMSGYDQYNGIKSFSDILSVLMDEKKPRLTKYKAILKKKEAEAKSKWDKQDASRSKELDKLMANSAIILDGLSDPDGCINDETLGVVTPYGSDAGFIGALMLFDLSTIEGVINYLENDEKYARKMIRAIGVPIKRGITNEDLAKLVVSTYPGVKEKTLKIKDKVKEYQSKKIK